MSPVQDIEPTITCIRTTSGDLAVMNPRSSTVSVIMLDNALDKQSFCTRVKLSCKSSVQNFTPVSAVLFDLFDALTRKRNHINVSCIEAVYQKSPKTNKEKIQVLSVHHLRVQPLQVAEMTATWVC